MRMHSIAASISEGSRADQSRRLKWWGSLLATSMIIALLASIFSKSYIGHHSLDLDEAGRVTTCESKMLDSVRPRPESVNLAMIGSVHALCYQEVAGADTLTDYGIRKSAYLNQQVQTTILMWMVVIITLSGVLLAGLQLVAGYRLAMTGKAAFEQGGQLSIEHSKISLGSSVTGLIILAISLAFFIVFVSKVYLIQEVHSSIDAPASAGGFPAVAVPTSQGGVVPPATASIGQPTGPSPTVQAPQPEPVPIPLQATPKNGSVLPQKRPSGGTSRPDVHTEPPPAAPSH